MTDFDYKKYSLENLEKWMSDALLSSEATPQEIYDVIRGVVDEEYHYFKHQTGRCYELLALLNGTNNLQEQVKAQGDVWDKEDACMPPWGHSDMEALRYSEEELNAMCDKAASDQEKDKCREYNLREAEYYNQRAQLDAKQDKVKKWILPVEEVRDEDTDKDEYCVTFPDDLLEAANLKEGDSVEWVDRGDGSYLLKKV